EELRRAGVAVDLGFSGNVKKRMARADKISALAAVILGDDELAKGVATLRDLRSGAQEQVPLTSLQDRLAALGREGWRGSANRSSSASVTGAARRRCASDCFSTRADRRFYSVACRLPGSRRRWSSRPAIAPRCTPSTGIPRAPRRSSGRRSPRWAA